MTERSMPIRLYNTLSRTKEVFKPIKNKQVGMYCCGPTVYWYAHLGNLRTYIFEDILRRVLEYNGYKVKHVMNFTDVGHLTSDEDTGNDKIEESAKKERKTAQEIANYYIAAFKRDAAALNIKPPTLYVRATDHIKEQIEIVKILEEKNFTYKIADGVYFDTSKLKDYGQLARLNLEGQKAGARVEVVQNKKNPADFAVWKFTPSGARRHQEWDSPWGRGFPGWHLECSAMARKYLGEQFDIHCGGIDHIPIHHTNEIAQSEIAYGKIPARFWLHGEFLLIDENKMAKSLGNLITVKKIAEKFNPLAFRYLTLTAHYRSPLNLTWESMEASQIALNNLYEKMRELNSIPSGKWRLTKLRANLDLASQKEKELFKKIRKYQEDFLEAINDDLDMPRAVSIFWQMVDNNEIPPGAKKELFLKFDRIFGFGFAHIKTVVVPPEIKKLVQQREQLRQSQDWEKADKIRRKIERAGWIVEDTPEGPKTKPKTKPKF